MTSGKLNLEEIPFLPTYNLEQLDDVLIWWFERNFSQAQYGKDAKYGTNSCTVIAILIAEIIAVNGIEVYN